MTEFDQTPRNKVMRYPKRGAYDTATIYPILDEALVCHVGFAMDGQPFVIPTIHARMGARRLQRLCPHNRSKLGVWASRAP